VLHDRQSLRGKERLHDRFIHADGGSEDAGAHVGDVRELEQPLHGAVFAERSM
jgi:hypothetical protein